MGAPLPVLNFFSKVRSLVIREIVGGFKRTLQPIMGLLRRVPLRVRGIVLVGLPLVAVVISATLAFLGSHQRANIEADVQRHFQMVSDLSDVITLMVNAETGMRGYLLTQRDEFLQPYATASQNLSPAMAHLRALAEAEPELNPRLEKLHRLNQLQPLIDRQMSDLAMQRQYVTAPNTFNTEIYSHLAYGKRLMDEIRVNLSAMQAEEGRLLSERVQEINAIRQRDYLAVFLVLGVALGARLIAWYLFNTGVLRRVKHLVENARALRRGDSLPFLPSSKLDALGDLEQEISLAGEQFAAQDGNRKSERSITSARQDSSEDQNQTRANQQ